MLPTTSWTVSSAVMLLFTLSATQNDLYTYIISMSILSLPKLSQLNYFYQVKPQGERKKLMIFTRYLHVYQCII